MSLAQWEPLLHDGLGRLGLSGHAGVQPFLTYARELERWSDRLGLVHATGEELVIRHLLDSLAALAVVQSLTTGSEPTIADIGTGGGLPGIPLACFLPDVTVHLVERSGRKCGFLSGTLLASRIRNAVVVNRDLSSVSDQFDVIVFRAFRPLSGPLVEQLMRLLKPGGAICAYKGRSERIQAEIGSLGEKVEARLKIEVVPVGVPHLEEERAVVIGRLQPESYDR